MPPEEGERNSHTEDECCNPIEQGSKRRKWTRTDVGQREDNVVHDDVNGDAIKGSIEPGMTPERKPAAEEKIDGRDGCSDEEVKKKPKQGRARALGEGCATDQSGGDALQDARG
jgi:hypothetical protein